METTEACRCYYSDSKTTCPDCRPKGRIHKVTDLRTGLQQYPMRGDKGRFLSRKQAASIMHYCDREIRESRIVAYCNVSGGIGIINPSSGSHTGLIRYG